MIHSPLKVNLPPVHAPFASPNPLARLTVDTLKLNQSSIRQIQAITTRPNSSNRLRCLVNAFSTKFDSLKSITVLRPAPEHRNKTTPPDCGDTV